MNDNQEPLNRSYDSVKDYPESLLNYIDKYVKVQLIKNISFSGFLHSIDPITLSVILSVPSGDNFQTTVVPGHAITDIKEVNPSTDMKPPARRCVADASDSNIMERKSQLTKWFKKNLLPVTESEDTLKIGNVSVLSPYSVTDICTDNPVVALQIRKIMETMPEDFDH